MRSQDRAGLSRDVLICAYAADPEIPSEPTIGWAFVTSALQAVAGTSSKVILLTNIRSGDAMRRWRDAEDLADQLEIVAVGLGRGWGWLERPRINALARFEYLLWYLAASRAVKGIVKERFIALAHHVTFATEMLPTPVIHAGRDAYKVWGPIGSDGAADVFRIEPKVSGTNREYLTQRVRDALSRLISPVLARRVDLVICSQEGNLSKILKGSGLETFAFPNLILPVDLIDDIRARILRRSASEESAPSEVQIMCVGHLIPRKRFELGIAILAEDGLEDAKIHFFGLPTGGNLDEYELMARSLGVTDRVVFHGKVPRAEVLDFMATADVLFHPAGREGAVGVIGEATTSGIPVVCFEDTGAALVLRAADGSGVMIDSRTHPSLAEIANCVVRAASMERGVSANWTVDRFDELERVLVGYTVSQRKNVQIDSETSPPGLTQLTKVLRERQDSSPS